jgi:hypothetical protein
LLSESPKLHQTIAKISEMPFFFFCALLQKNLGMIWKVFQQKKPGELKNGNWILLNGIESALDDLLV